MREAILARFFEGKVTAAALAHDLEGAGKRLSPIYSAVEIEDLQEEFVVTAEMAIELCDAVLRDELPADSLAAIGFALIASDKFAWDGDSILGEVICDWPSPKINYALTRENVERFRSWLSGTEEYPVKGILPEFELHRDRSISVRWKNLKHTVRRWFA